MSSKQLVGTGHVPDLDGGYTLDGTEWMHVVDRNGNSRRIPILNIAALAPGLSATAELIRDTIGTALVAGTNISVTVNDAGDTITIAATGIDAEAVRDTIGAALVAGSGITITVNDAGDTITIATSAAGSPWKMRFRPMDNEAPSASFATLDTRNARPCLDFDAAAAESAVFTDIMPNDYSGAGITVILFWGATSATSGNVMWQAALERCDAGGQDLGSDGFATAQAFAAAVANGTSGKLTKTSLNISNGANMDSIAAGDLFRLKITRDAANGSDTMTGDAELYGVMVVPQ